MENTKYTEEFKQSIVSLYESGKAVRRYAKNTEWAVPRCINGSKNIQKSGFRNWNHDHGRNQKNAKEISLAWGGKYNIKKAMAIFSRESGKE